TVIFHDPIFKFV
ncbi:hypothetical protein Hypma_009805, partial [Hypsizygus marmoreus]